MWRRQSPQHPEVFATSTLQSPRSRPGTASRFAYPDPPMPRRIDVELTSARDDGSWTWRAAGARQPRGVVDGSLLPGEAKVGDVFRAEVDIDLDGINITQVAPPREARPDPERLTLIGPSVPESLVSTSLVPGGKRAEGRSGGGRSTERRGRGRDRAEPRRDRRPSGDRSDHGDRDRGEQE